MMNKRKKYTPEEKANIVLETLREDNTLAEIAHKYDVSQQLISRWRSEFLANMPSVISCGLVVSITLTIFSFLHIMCKLCQFFTFLYIKK